jgi:hypothetical protein
MDLDSAIGLQYAQQVRVDAVQVARCTLEHGKCGPGSRRACHNLLLLHCRGHIPRGDERRRCSIRDDHRALLWRRTV